MSSFKSIAAVSAAVLAVSLASRAQAAVVITQSAAPAPTYSTTLSFDEPASPAGSNVPINSWSGAPWNITSIASGDGAVNTVGDNSALTGSATNSYRGPWGVLMNFGQDLSEASFQGWDSSGPSSPFGGGVIFAVFNNGVQINGFQRFAPAWAGAGNSWYNVTTTDGTIFDEIRFLGNGLAAPNAVVDNISFTAVPEPASQSMLAAGALIAMRRRRLSK